MSKENIVGQKFARLEVLEFKPGKGIKRAGWLCKCECGNTVAVDTNKLKSGHTKSCGCLKTEGKHKDSYTRLYQIWSDMKSRCCNANIKNWSRYGGRGISVNTGWKHDYLAFKNWAMANGYSKDLTIDRINVDGNYEPDNCRWATDKQQSNNKGNNRCVEFENQVHTLAEWSEIKGIIPKTLEFRLDANWKLEDVFNKPTNKKFWHDDKKIKMEAI